MGYGDHGYGLWLWFNAGEKDSASQALICPPAQSGHKCSEWT